MNHPEDRSKLEIASGAAIRAFQTTVWRQKLQMDQVKEGKGRAGPRPAASHTSAGRLRWERLLGGFKTSETRVMGAAKQGARAGASQEGASSCVSQGWSALASHAVSLPHGFALLSTMELSNHQSFPCVNKAQPCSSLC